MQVVLSLQFTWFNTDTPICYYRILFVPTKAHISSTKLNLLRTLFYGQRTLLRVLSDKLWYLVNTALRTVLRSRWLDIGQFFFCMFMDLDGIEVHKLAKNRTRPISSHLDRTSLVNKRFRIWLSVKFSCGKQRVVPSGQDSSILPARVANHKVGFGSSCPLTEPA